MFKTTYSQVVINEIMSSNHNCITDEDGDNSDWIELYNFGNEEIDLTGYYLSDKDENVLMWKLPEVSIKTKEFLLIFASGKDRSFAGKELHTNFKISKYGEPVILSDNSGNFIDRLPPAYVETDYSFGRFPDAKDSLYIFKTPTPGAPNTGLFIIPIYANLKFSHNPGYYKNDFLLQIYASENVDIRYTVDASFPTDTSSLYTGAIRIDSRAGTENYYSEIPSAIPKYWTKPLGEVPKIWTIRARPFLDGIPVGNEIWGSFWIGHHNPDNIELPVVSVITSPENLFDYEYGIYVPGINYDDGGEGNYFLRGEERDAFLTFFDENGIKQVNQEVGIRIQGQATRKYSQKSLRIYAREKYGKDEIAYKFFPERENEIFKRLLLNSTMGDDWTRTLFKDELCAYLVKDLDLDYLAFIPVIAFINGEYWGIHFLKERRDEYYLAQNHNINPNKIDRLTNNMDVVSGNALHYQEMINFITNNDPKDPKTYEKVKTYMDVENFIDYKCMQIYLNNRDWPHNNLEFWRPDTTGGKWRWIFWDLDRAFEEYQTDNLTIYRTFEENYSVFFLLRMLLKMPEFERKFINRFYYHLNNTVNTKIVLEAIDHFKQTLTPYVPNHILRWRTPLTMYEWEKNIQSLTSFAMQRPTEMLYLLKQIFDSPFTIAPNPANETLNIFYEWDAQKNTQIEIYNIAGQQIDIGSKIIATEPYFQININELQSGVYLVKIINEGMVFTHKFVKTN